MERNVRLRDLREIRPASLNKENNAELDSATNAFVPEVVDGTLAHDGPSTTHYTSDANITSVGAVKPQYTPSLLVDASTDLHVQSIISFLAKPVIAQQGSFSVTDTASTFAAVPAHVPFQNDIHADKIRGFLGLRFDLVIRLVVNASRFQAGRYMIVWNPYGGTDYTLKFAAMKTARIFRLTQRTTMPHAEIDISCDTELEFVIPYSNSLNFCPSALFTNAAFTYGSIGEAQIFPYSALNAVTGATTCSYTMYYSMRNVSLYGAAVPQSSGFSVSRRNKSYQNREQLSSGMGPISSTLATVSESLNILSRVPLVSSYARTTAWFADRMAKTAEVFGFSKPTNLEHPQRVTKNVFHYISSVDGPDQSMPLALSYKNEVAVLAADSPTDLDEMDLNFIASIPAYVQTQTWTTAQTAGTQLASIPVTPLFGSFAQVINGATVITDAPCSFVSRYFKYWRGSVVFKFKIVRTEFHSGRLVFSFNPVFSDISANVTPSYTDTNYVHREVVDIREHTEVCLTIPYISPAPFTECIPKNGNGAIGNLTVHVVDALVCPATVATSISIMVEIAAGPDMQWSFPVPNTISPYMNAVPQSGTFRQGNTYDSVCNILVKTIGSMTVKDDNDLSALLCVGEKVSSFRTMVKKPWALTQAGAQTPGIMAAVVPFMTSVVSRAAVTNQIPGTNPDLYSVLSTMYVYSRGSVRIKILDSNAIPTIGASMTVMQNFAPPTPPTQVATTGAVTYTGATAVNIISGMMPLQTNLIEQGVEFQVPPYYKLPMRVNVDTYTNGVLPYSGQDGTNVYQHVPEVYVYRFMTDFTTTQNPRFWRSMGDDGNFSYFLSCPPYIFTQTAF
jgi:hypothetical protein